MLTLLSAFCAGLSIGFLSTWYFHEKRMREVNELRKEINRIRESIK